VCDSATLDEASQEPMERSSNWSRNPDFQSGQCGFESRSLYMSTYRKSSKCANATCVEVKISSHVVSVRDNEGAVVMYTHDEWKAFVEGVKLGEFDVE
jgi:hypothetical protein